MPEGAVTGRFLPQSNEAEAEKWCKATCDRCGTKGFVWESAIKAVLSEDTPDDVDLVCEDCAEEQEEEEE